MSQITSTDVSTETHGFFRRIWDSVDRSGVSDTTVITVNDEFHTGIVYTAATDSFLFTPYAHDQIQAALFYNVNPNVCFVLSFVLNWKLYHRSNIFRIAWGDNTSRYQVELRIDATTTYTAFAPTAVRLLYKASDGKIYQIINKSVNAIFNETDHVCAISSNETGDVAFSIDGVNIFTVNDLDVMKPGGTERLINRTDRNYYGQFGFCYDFIIGGTTLRMDAIDQGSIKISGVDIQNFNYIADNLVVDGKITAKEYEYLENQPIIAGMSNLLYNELKHQKVNLQYNNYTAERQYPPTRNFTSNTHTVSNQAYGNGVYTVSSAQTPVNTATTQPYAVLDGSTNTYFQARAQYSFTDSSYSGIPFSIVLSDGSLKEYRGLEITLGLPVSILLTKIMLNVSVRVTDHTILGSNDGLAWTEIVAQTGLTLSNSTLNTIALPATHTTAFKYYKYVLQKITPYFSGNNTVQVNELYLLGKEYTVDTFFTASNNVITTTANVGIGTTSPSSKLDVRGGGVRFEANGDWLTVMDSQDRMLTKFTRVTGTNNTQLSTGFGALLLNPNTFVGIKNSAPAYTLDVTGTVNATTYNNLPTASTSAAGVVQLDNTFPLTSSSTSTTQAPTVNVVRQLYNLIDTRLSSVGAASATTAGMVKLSNDYPVTGTDTMTTISQNVAKQIYDLANGKWSAVDASTTTKGIVQLDDTYPLTSTSTTQAPTVNALRQVYNLANTANGKTSSQWSTITGGIGYYSGKVEVATNLSVFNGTNAAGNIADLSIATAGALTTGPRITFDVWGVGGWKFLQDVQDSNKLKISSKTSSGENVRLALLTDGSVGIGTVSPAYALDVRGDQLGLTCTNVNVNQQLVIKSTVGRAGMILIPSNNTALQTLMYTQPGGGLVSSVAANTNFIFQVSGLGYESLRLTSDGKAGVGLYNPGSKLSVSGNCSIGTYATTAAPSNGLIVSGNVGLGVSTPTVQLQVANDTILNRLKIGSGNSYMAGVSYAVSGTISTAWILNRGYYTQTNTFTLYDSFGLPNTHPGNYIVWVSVFESGFYGLSHYIVNKTTSQFSVTFSTQDSSKFTLNSGTSYNSTTSALYNMRVDVI